MKKKGLLRVGDNIHLIFNNAAQWFKTGLEATAQEISTNSISATGIILKLISKPIIDHYFATVTKSKLNDFGSNTYMKAAYEQAAQSIDKIASGITSQHTAEEIIETFKTISASSFERVQPDNLLLVFQPKYHPIVLKVKDSYVEMLKALYVEPQTISAFKKDFNENIADTVQKAFGEDYDTHKEQIKDFITDEKETLFLYDMFQLARIGFEENEQLSYETTYGHWEELYKEKIELLSDHEPQEEIEKKLKTVKELVEEYFAVEPSNHLEKILFVIADFGKGKSVFMKNYAAELAQQYSDEQEGFFPVYFNLREFSRYNPDGHLGILDDFLVTKYGIKIDSDTFRNRKYMFLVDSLDESGELSRENIEKVIHSVKKIQNLSKEHMRENRIIISSRPLADGFQEMIGRHRPHCISKKKGIEKEHYISLYGFKKEQFNNWLYKTIRAKGCPSPATTVNFVSQIYESIEQNKPVDIYKELLKNRTLQRDELRRPIFAYMIYQLIVNNIDFLQLGKIGIYLSFINLLTKDAKHIKDTNYKVDLKQEFGFRNILHATAALWMYERHNGNQGFLKKADLCRVLEGENKYNAQENDTQILGRYKQNEITEIQFISHSYFGEDNNTLHFQHQSFAEILLAEYYLKVFIKFALQDNVNIEEARTRLMLGEPTEQTISFLRGLLQLLRQTVSDTPTEAIIEKRKLLFPLLCSLAIQKNNLLFSEAIYYEWYKKGIFTKGNTEYPDSLLTGWYIDKDKIDKILSLAKEIIESPHQLLLAKPKTRSVLYNNELLLFYNQHTQYIQDDMDKWLSLLIGNELYNNTENKENPLLFNMDFKINYQILFEMIKSDLYKNRISTYWRRKLTMGLNMKENEDEDNYIISEQLFFGYDFSYSYLKKINFSFCDFFDTDFNNTVFDEVFFNNSSFNQTRLSIQKILDLIAKNILIGGILISEMEYTKQRGLYIGTAIFTGKRDIRLFFFIFLGYLIRYEQKYYKGKITKIKLIFEKSAQKEAFIDELKKSNIPTARFSMKVLNTSSAKQQTKKTKQE